MTSAQEQNQLATLSTVLLTNLDENLFFSKISEHVLREFGEYKVQVFEAFIDGSTTLKAENGKLTENGMTYAKGEGLSGYVVRMKRAYYSNSKRDPLLATTKRDECIESELAVPVIIDGSILATIHIQSNKSERKFSEEDILRVNDFLREIETPLTNLKMYLIAKHLNKQLEDQLKLKELELLSRESVTTVTNKKVIEAVEIIGHSNTITDVLKTAEKVAREDFPVMLVGASGAGKKILAKRIHTLSNRAQGECIVVHCSAIEDSQLEVELFGREDREGIFERANGGTIIFDVIEELSLNLQAKVLRTILSGEVYRVDSNIPRSVNVRIISTTKSSIQKAVEEGRFREDLIYRLNIVSIQIPSLNERTDDIKVLAEYFMNNGKNQDEYKMLTSRAIEKLMKYNWPGNIQELRNVMERTYILADDRYIDEHHLPNLVSESKPEAVSVDQEYVEMTLHDLEKLHIVRSLENLGGNKTKAAKSLGITVKTLYNKLHSYGLVQSKSE